MKCELLVSVCVVAAVLGGCCLGAAEAGPVEQLEQNIGGLRKIASILTFHYGEVGNMQRVEVMLLIEEGKMGIDLAKAQPLGLLSPLQERQLAGALYATNPHELANKLVMDAPEHMAQLLESAPEIIPDAERMFQSAEAAVAMEILEIPGLVTLDAMAVAKRMGFRESALDLINLAGEHNTRAKGKAPACILSFIPKGQAYAQDLWEGKTVSLPSK